ncbi:MAG TPA: hypothetical protein VEI07_21895 [Planctomycetaceae bacterium]|nr:hypothetical protein [Planctomycetaceae bacterium]
MRALFFSAALVSAALCGCVRCSIPLNAPPYDPAQWGWGPQDHFYVTRSFYGFAKDYPGTHPYYMVPPNAPVRFIAAGPACANCGPTMIPVWSARAPMGGPNGVAPTMVMGPAAVGPNVAVGPTAVAF